LKTDVNISRGRLAACRRIYVVGTSIMITFFCKFSVERACASEGIVKIAQYLMQLWQKKLGDCLFGPLCVKQFKRAFKSTRVCTRCSH